MNHDDGDADLMWLHDEQVVGGGHVVPVSSCDNLAATNIISSSSSNSNKTTYLRNELEQQTVPPTSPAQPQQRSAVSYLRGPRGGERTTGSGLFCLDV